MMLILQEQIHQLLLLQVLLSRVMYLCLIRMIVLMPMNQDLLLRNLSRRRKVHHLNINLIKLIMEHLCQQKRLKRKKLRVKLVGDSLRKQHPSSYHNKYLRENRLQRLIVQDTRQGLQVQVMKKISGSLNLIEINQMRRKISGLLLGQLLIRNKVILNRLLKQQKKCLRQEVE